MKKKLAITMIIILIIVIVAGIVIINTKEKGNSEQQNILNYVFISDLDKEEFDFFGEIDYYYSPDDIDALAKYTDYVIIGKVETIEKQYWEKEQNSTLTLGTLKVKKVYKGELKKGQEISFVRDGGIISLNEFEVSLGERSRVQLEKLSLEERIKKYGLDELTKEEKNNQYVFDGAKGNIPVEINKTYLMYLTYNENLERYEIEHKLYGLREIDTSKFIFNYNNAKVKNNQTGQFEYMEVALSQELFGKSVFTILKEKLFIRILELIGGS